MSGSKIVGLSIAVVLEIVLLYGYYWFMHPAISFADPGFCFLVFMIVSCIVIDVTFAGWGLDDGILYSGFGIGGFLALAVVVGLIGSFMSCSLVNSETYYKQAEVSKNDFANDIDMVSFSTIPLMDKDTAVLLGDRAMGVMSDLVSQYEISDQYSQINLDGRPVRVSPLKYDGFFKWMNSKDAGIPGYVRVDMSNENTEIVRTETPIWISDGEYFERNVYRHVQLSYPFDIFSAFYFEIDDEGNPWWLCPIKSFEIFPFGAESVHEFVMCNAHTGECSRLSLEDAPEWCDKVLPTQLLIDRYNWHGELADGFWNSVFEQSGVTHTTEGYNYIVIDNDVWVYSGVTSASSDNAIVGFILMNQRTGETNYYECAGAKEVSAMESAEGQVQQMSYEASFPLLINIADQPTYIMTLKDNAGLVKMYAMVDVQRYQNVAVGSTLTQTLENYTSMLNSTGIAANASDIESDADGANQNKEQVSGKITKMVQIVRDGNTHFVVEIDGYDGRKFDFDIMSNIDIIDYAEGDTISFVVSIQDVDVENVSYIGVLEVAEHDEPGDDKSASDEQNDTLTQQKFDDDSKDGDDAGSGASALKQAMDKNARHNMEEALA